MKIASDRCGLTTGTSSEAVTKRRVMAYAAGLGAERDAYLNDLRPDGILASPPFVVALEWTTANGPEFRTALGADQDTMQASVHVLQDTRFHRPIRPGDHLTTDSQIVAIRPTSAGTYLVRRFRTTAADGAVVAETESGAIFLRVPVDGAPQVIGELAELRPDRDLPDGPDYEEAIPVARTLPHIYTECAAIWNPIHSELAEARKAQLPDIILQGTCTWALAGERLIDRYGQGDPARMRRLGGRFHGMVVPGLPIQLRAREMDRRDGVVSVAYAVENAQGELAITSGIAEFAV
jgi:acyl dehydratase